MKSKHALGLVVGKFSPLHRGHEWLVEQAAAACEALLVLSYSAPEFPRCEASARQRWMQACLASRHAHVECLALDDAGLAARCAARGQTLRPMPPNEAADAVQQDWLAWLLREVLDLRPDALFSSEAYGPPCAQVLSRAFGKPVASVAGDLARQAVPISATRIRRHPQAHRVWLSPPVWGDFVPRVVLLGGESSGKTTLARALAQALQTRWVPEYGRELWERQGGHLDEADLLRIAREQIRREDEAACQARTHLVCDTSPLTTLGYSLWMFGQAAPELAALAARPYDLQVLCAPDIPFDQDGTRRDPAFREQQHAWYVDRLKDCGTPVLTVRGSVEERVATVRQALDRLEAQAQAQTPHANA